MTRRPAALLAALALLAATAARAEETCDFDAIVTDPDPAGTNVRAAPDAKAEVLFVMPHAHGEDDLAPEVHVRALRRGWAQIDTVTVGGYGDEPERVVFAGTGWVSTRLIGFAFGGEDARLHAAPADDAAVTLDMNGEGTGPDSVTVTAIRGCRGRWVDVDVTTGDGRKGRGWGVGVCANQVTTCS